MARLLSRAVGAAVVGRMERLRNMLEFVLGDWGVQER